MPIPDKTLTRILGSIEAQNLTLLCGAGLSVPQPSALMSAVGVAKACYDAYAPILQLPPELRENIDGLAGHFFDSGEFRTLFIGSLVPWDSLTGRPNEGHAAVGDFIVSGAITAALSANFDLLIEQWAMERKVALEGSLTGEEAVRLSAKTKPLLKFHGCLLKKRDETIWTQKQLDQLPFSASISSCTTWMHQHLADKDLLIIGFWTDWDYLNAILTAAFQGTSTRSITVIDKLSSAELEKKGPELWGRLSALPNFHHLQMSSDDALAEIRTAFSKVWVRKLFGLGKAIYQQTKGPCDDVLDQSSSLALEALYEIRCDTEARGNDQAARLREPPNSASQVGYAHILLAEKTNQRERSWYVVDNETVRVIQGAGEALSTVQARFSSAPAIEQSDTVICVGALDYGVPARIIATGGGSSVVRPGNDRASRWLTFDSATQEFQL